MRFERGTKNRIVLNCSYKEFLHLKRMVGHAVSTNIPGLLSTAVDFHRVMNNIVEKYIATPTPETQSQPENPTTEN